MSDIENAALAYANDYNLAYSGFLAGAAWQRERQVSGGRLLDTGDNNPGQPFGCICDIPDGNHAPVCTESRTIRFANQVSAEKKLKFNGDFIEGSQDG